MLLSSQIRSRAASEPDVKVITLQTNCNPLRVVWSSANILDAQPQYLKNFESTPVAN